MPTALITGAAGGIGRAICRAFADEGYRVIGIDRDHAEGIPCQFMQMDICTLTRPGPDSEAPIAHLRNLCGGDLTVIVHNAAVQVVKPMEEITPADWDISISTNLLAPFWLTRLFLATLRASRGSVINIASIHAHLTKANFTPYATTKGALVAMTRSLAIDLAPEVRVNAILPAATDTPMLRAGFENDTNGLHMLGDFHPLGRIARPEEIADVALFLASSRASFITGTAIHVDGGIGGCLHDPVQGDWTHDHNRERVQS